MDLIKKNCVPCSEGAPKLKGEELHTYMSAVDDAWQLVENDTKITRTLEFENFQQCLDFINQVGEIAEKQSHHPNICLHDYKLVTIQLYTHKINGLHANDFILAHKIDGLY